MLTVSNLTVGYGQAPALADVSLEVGAGEVVAVVGSNGAGKTTLLRAVSGLLRPWTGVIRFKGSDVTTLPAHRRSAMGMGLVPEGRRLFRGLTVAENIRLGAYLRTDAAGIRADMDWLYRLFPVLKERSRQIAGNMSGGEQQMCATARALMARPQLLAVDELSAGLAPVIVTQLLEALIEVTGERGLTLLMVEQDVVAALEVADRGYVLEHGRLVLSGPARELMARDEIRQAYLGM